MRPVVPGDLDHCVRSLLSVPVDARPATMQSIIRRADLADRYRKRTGKLLRGAGDGSLMTAAWTFGRAPPAPRCDSAYCATLALVIEALGDWRTRDRATRRQPANPSFPVIVNVTL